MGTVIAAYDPTLDRKVALKIVRPDASGTTSGRQRLVREAHAMAKLQHPNVVTVFEVGTYEDRVFLAMEYVAGSTLSEWLARPGRTRRELLDAFFAAGRGLAAAHREGIVHRDFKPANVLVAKDGRVRVADFGLATAPAEPITDDVGDTLRDSGPTLGMTRTGAVLGTPAYMSPEQHRGEPADARADQYAFCVALYEALYRELPFEGTTFLAYHDNVLAGRVREVPRGSDVPARLRRALLRGFALAPGDRYPDMNALLAELGRDVAAVRRRIAGGAIAVGAIGAFAFAVLRSDGASDPCAASVTPVAGVWSAPSRAAVELAFAASRAPGAADAFDRVDRELTSRAVALRAARHEACEATEIRHEQSAELLDRRMQCIDDHAAAVNALAAVLADRPDRTVVAKSIAAALALPPLEPCADRAQLLAGSPLPPPAVRGEVDTFSRTLDHAHALAAAGRYLAALEQIHAIAPAVDALGYAHLSARLHADAGDSHMQIDQEESALAELHRAVEFAAAAHDDRIVAQAWIRIYATARYDEARVLESVAAAAVARAGRPPELVAGLETARGKVALGHENFADSIRHLREAARQNELADGPRSLSVAHALGNLATALTTTGQYDEARGLLERSIAIKIEKLGTDHPEVGVAYHLLGDFLDDTGDPAKALEQLRKAAAIDAKVYPPDSDHVAGDFVSLGVVLSELGRLAEGLDYAQRAVAIFDLHAADHRHELANALFDLANTYRLLARPKDAMATLDRALEIAEADHATDTVSQILILRGIERQTGGDLVGSKQDFERSLAIRQQGLGPDHPRVAEAIENLAENALKRGDPREAVRIATNGIAVLDRSSAPRASFRFFLLDVRGRAEIAAGDARAALADEIAAREGFAEAGMAEDVIGVRMHIADAKWAIGGDDSRHAARAEVQALLDQMLAAKTQDAGDIATARDWLTRHP